MNALLLLLITDENEPSLAQFIIVIFLIKVYIP